MGERDMVLMSLGKVTTVVPAGSMKLAEHRPAAVQVVFRTAKLFWVTKPIILRNIPVTAVRPTPRLAEWRYRFASEASKWKGATGVGTLKQDSVSKKHKKGDTVLAVQAKAQEVLKAAPKPTKGRAATYDETAARYRSYIRYKIHTPEELKKLAGI
jgi:hypothetical protein